jgi:hypothetical protein
VKKKYHYLWIAEAGNRLLLDMGDVDKDGFVVPEKTRTHCPSTASRARLQRALMHLKPDTVYLHREGPSLTYYVKRGHKFPAPTAIMLMLKVA